MSYDHISPELALIDPRLATHHPRKVGPMIAPFDSEPGTPTSSNSVPATKEAPSIEGLLFAAGAISADQLGEIVRDAVLTQRPVAAVALEGGFVTRETLDQVIAASGPQASFGDVLGQADTAPAPATAPLRREPEVPRAVAPAVQPIASLAQPALVLPPPEALAPLTPTAVQQAVAAAAPPRVAPAPAVAVLPLEAPLPPVAPTPVEKDLVLAPDREPSPHQNTPAVAPSDQTFSAPACFAVSIRLDSGERVPVDSANGFDRATELARGIVETLSVSDGWPFASGRFIRPGAIVSVDIERALGD